MTPPNPDYPVRLEIDQPASLSRGLIFVKWLLAIPHLIALVFLGIGLYVVGVIAFFAVLFTGRYPEGLFNYVVGVMRWGVRVGAYVYLLTDAYPPFSLQDDRNYPVRLDVDYPPGIANWRPLVSWLLVIPAGVCAGLLGFAAYLASVVAWFAILFTGNMPQGVFDLIATAMRWQNRVIAYAYFMTEQYPPFVYA